MRHRPLLLHGPGAIGPGRVVEFVERRIRVCVRGINALDGLPGFKLEF